MTTLIPTAIMMMSLTVAQASSGVATPSQQWRPEVVVNEPQSNATISSLLERLAQGDNPLEQAWRNVFVVPGPDLSMDGMATITEDMVIMCRILDKAIAPTGASAFPGYDPYGGRSFNTSSQTQGLYLDGYGALFFVETGFPLVPPPPEPNLPDNKPAGDPVWSQTVNELKGVPQKESQARVPAFDAQKVENLKNILVKSLRHATNLRVRGPQDRFTVVITNGGQGASSFAYATTGSAVRFGTSLSRPASSDVLILRTAKPDVDAFAKGTLTLEQFTEKVEVLRSWTNSVADGPTSTGIVVPSSGSSNMRR